MTTQTIFYASPYDSAITGFIFIDLDSYLGEYDHRHCLFGTENYELQIIRGNQIDQELFAGLKFGNASLSVWFDEIQHLTFDEKVGLWFLVHESGFGLTQALDAIQDGVTVLHGTQEEMAYLSWQSTAPGMDFQFQEFNFAGETWVGCPAGYF